MSNIFRIQLILIKIGLQGYFWKFVIFEDFFPKTGFSQYFGLFWKIANFQFFSVPFGCIYLFKWTNPLFILKYSISCPTYFGFSYFGQKLTCKVFFWEFAIFEDFCPKTGFFQYFGPFLEKNTHFYIDQKNFKMS